MRRLCLLFAAALLLPGIALAAPDRAAGSGPDTQEDKFRNMDQNSDGALAREEFFETYPHLHEAAFKSIDKNGDNLIILEEWLNFSSSHSRDMGGGPVMREMFREDGRASAPEAAPMERKPLFELRPKDESQQ